MEWCTYSENLKHAFNNGLKNHKGIDHPYSKLKEKDVINIRNVYNKKTNNLKSLAKKYNVHYATISLIINNKTWRHI